MAGQHEQLGLQDGGWAERQVHSHLVPIEVRVEGRTGEWVQLERLALDHLRLESLDTEAVKGRCTIKQNWMFLDHFFKDSPYPGIIFLQFALSIFDRMNFLVIDQSMENEGLE